MTHPVHLFLCLPVPVVELFLHKHPAVTSWIFIIYTSCFTLFCYFNLPSSSLLRLQMMFSFSLPLAPPPLHAHHRSHGDSFELRPFLSFPHPRVPLHIYHTFVCLDLKFMVLSPSYRHHSHICVDRAIIWGVRLTLLWVWPEGGSGDTVGMHSLHIGSPGDQQGALHASANSPDWCLLIGGVRRPVRSVYKTHLTWAEAILAWNVWWGNVYDVMSAPRKKGLWWFSQSASREADTLWAALWAPAGSRSPISNAFHMLKRSARHEQLWESFKSNIIT